MQQRLANRTGWIGRENFAEAQTPDRFGEVEDAWVRSRASLAVGYPTYLPTVMPWLEQYIEPEMGMELGGAIMVPYGASERPNPAMPVLEGDRYYGWVSDQLDGRPQSGYATPALSAGAPLVDPSGFYYHGDVPLDASAPYSEPPPMLRGGLYG